MTEYEKTELVNAFYAIRSANPDRITDMANFHMDFFNYDNIDPDVLDIHFNLPDEPEKEIFLAWHRRFIFEMEQVMQDINPRISIPYWDSSEDQSTTSDLWSEDFMGSFNTNWGLGRRLGQYNDLPTPNDIASMLTETDFFEFSDFFERRPPHSGAHRWVNGPMITSASPRDPVFYLHHVFVDKLWHDWEEVHQTSFYLRNDMIRYDGTYVFGGQTLPVVDPNDIVDSRALGVFYAEDQLAQLNNYIVSNTYNAEEYFYYQYTIEAGNDFIAPSGTNSVLESVNEILLQPGFLAQSGAELLVTIDTQTSTMLLARSNITSAKREKNFFEEVDLEQVWLWSEGDVDPDDAVVVIKTFPNPFDNHITIKLNKKRDCVIEIYNMVGALVKQQAFEFTDTLEINNLFGLSSGTYVVKVVDSQGGTLVVKKVIKM
jgi:tyrosinase